MGLQRGATPERSTDNPMHPSSGGRIVALCAHEVPRQQAHMDLFLASTGAPFGDDERVLETWRLPVSPCALLPGHEMVIEPLGLHRGLYARLERIRDLGEGRGMVTPVARGLFVASALGDGGRILDITWSDGNRLLLGLQPGRTSSSPARLQRLMYARLDG